MHIGLLHTHSFLRFAVLILLIIVIIMSLLGWMNKKGYSSTDNKLNLFLFIATHTQLLVGLILYFVSPVVKSGDRYWKFEHATIMLIAVVLITMARTTAKKMSDAPAKHKRLFIFNTIALVLILTGIVMSGRGFI